MGAAGMTFALLAVLAATGLADPRLAAAAFGLALLAAGADGVAGALVAGWPREPWAPPPGGRPVRAGRLSSLVWGLVLGSVGALLIGLDRVPQPSRLVAGAVAVVGLALTLVGQSYDRRRVEAARGGPDAEPPAAPARGGLS
jgi:hypothetical protein